MSEMDRRDFLERTASSVALLSLLSPEALAARSIMADGLGVGIVGVGRQGRAIATQLQKFENIRIVAMADTDERRINAAKRRVGDIPAFPDHRALLDAANDVSAIFIATPTPTHRQIALDCIQAGKHVYCEAPLAHTPEDCMEIAGAARGASTVFQTGLQGRSNPVYQLARTFYRSDSVRDLVAMRAQRHRKTSWRTPASDPAREKALNWRLDKATSLGLAGEWGVHQFDVFHWYVGAYPSRVSGSGSIRMHDDGRDVFDTIQADLRFPNGAVLQYGATLANSYGGQQEVIFGTNAAIKLAWTHGWLFKEADAPTQGWEVYANRQQFHNDEGITLIADATQLASQGKLKEGVGLPYPSLYYAVADFLESVTDGAKVTCSADEGARATIVAIETCRAIRQGSPVEIDSNALRGS